KEKAYWQSMKAISAKERVFLVVLMMNFKCQSLHKDDDIVDSYIKRKGKLISLNDFDRLNIHHIFRCDGLLLCIVNGEEKINKPKLTVWNLIAGKQDGSNQEVLYKSCDTSKRFGLPLTFYSYPKEGVATFSNRGAARCVISAQGNIEDVGSGVTTKIEPKELFLAVDMRPIICFQVKIGASSFFIDEKNKVVILINKKRKSLLLLLVTVRLAPLATYWLISLEVVVTVIKGVLENQQKLLGPTLCAHIF
ncbi:LOW QUALITY PROTEIN: hypothetical protein HID58_003200, partial [Brassica napus]